jgi:hypothetical protein
MGHAESTCNGPCTSPLHSLKRWGLEVGGAASLEVGGTVQRAAGSRQLAEYRYPLYRIIAKCCELAAVCCQLYSPCLNLYAQC